MYQNRGEGSGLDSGLTLPEKPLLREFVVPRTNLCILCSTESTQKYHIYSKSIHVPGPAKALVENFLNICLAQDKANNGAYVCKTCKRAIESHNNHRDKMETICSKLKGQNAQELRPVTGCKRVMHGNVSPKTKKKSRTSNEPCAPVSPQKFTLTPAKESPFKPTDESNKNTPQNKPKTPECYAPIGTRSRKQKRTERSIPFRNGKIASKMYPIAWSLRNGSVRDALSVIQRRHPKEFHQCTVRIIRQEAVQISENDNSRFLRENDPKELLENMSLNNMQQQVERVCPLAWAVACTVATNSRRNYKFKKWHVLTAFLILLSSRSQKVNKFQVLMALALHRHNISKEGINLLQAIGVSVSPATLLSKLKAIEQKVITDVYNLKSQLEQNRVSRSTGNAIHVDGWMDGSSRHGCLSSPLYMCQNANLSLN